MTGLTTHALAARVRTSAMLVDPKRMISVRALDDWLQELAARGIVEQHDGEWRLTTRGELWLRPLAQIPVGPEAVAA